MSQKEGSQELLGSIWEAFRLLQRRDQLVFSALVLARVGINILDLVGLFGVGLLGAMISAGITGGQTASFLDIEIAVEPRSNFLLVVFLVTVFFAAKSLLAAVLLRLTTVFLGRAEAKSASAIAEFFFSRGISEVRSTSTGEIQWAVSSSSQIAFSSILYSAAALVSDGTLFLMVFLGFVFIDWETAILVAAYFAGLLLVFHWFVNQRLRRLGERTAENSVMVNDSILDIISVFREVSVLQKTSQMLRRFHISRHRLAADFSLQRFVMAVPRFFIEAALMLGLLGLVLWQFWLGSIAEALAITGVFLAGGTRMLGAILPIQNAVANLKVSLPQAGSALRIIRDSQLAGGVLQRDREVGDSPKSEGFSTGLDVSMDSISFIYPGAAEETIRGVSLSIESGQFAAFVGPSGAGKTTLVDLLLGLHMPSDGSVLVSGMLPRELQSMSPGNMAYVPQSPGLLSGSLAENVALGVPEELIDVGAVEEALYLAGLGSLISQLPQGIHSRLGNNSDALSGGQLQRLGIARALYPKPRLLVLDEPTSALDAETEAGISETLYQLRGRCTLIVIAHRLSTIKRADKVFVIEEGKISAEGALNELRQRVPLIERYVQLMSIDT